ncbi:MAG: hypothetical protein ACTHKE_06300 [Sphingomicrobium sp.]
MLTTAIQDIAEALGVLLLHRQMDQRSCGLNVLVAERLLELHLLLVIVERVNPRLADGGKLRSLRRSHHPEKELELRCLARRSLVRF